MHTGSLHCSFRWQPDTPAPSALGAKARQPRRQHLGACIHAVTAPRRQPASKEQTPVQQPTVLTSFSDIDEMTSAPEMPGRSTCATQYASSTTVQPLEPPRNTGVASMLLFALPMHTIPLRQAESPATAAALWISVNDMHLACP